MRERETKRLDRKTYIKQNRGKESGTSERERGKEREGVKETKKER